MTTGEAWRPKRGAVAAWALYDLANTVFALGVAGLYFPQWLIDDKGWNDLDLALAINGAMVVIIVLGPWLGARSDHAGRRRRFLIGPTLLAVTASFFLASTSVGVSLALFSAALVGFHLGSLFYDALLVDVSTDENRGRVSGIGVGVGYLGSFVAVLTGRLLLDRYGHAVLFRTLAVLFLCFAVPAFAFIRERPRSRKPGPPPGPRRVAVQVVRSWRTASHYPGVVRFLVGRFFYSDAINTLIGGFLTVFVLEEIGFTTRTLEELLAVGILASVIGGLAGGRITDAVGPRRALHGALYLWMVSWVFGLVAATTGAKPLAGVLVIAGGLALGATWTADRAYMARISPPAHFAEFYGLYATVGRFATILGPLLWGLIVTVMGLSRSVAMAVLLGFLVIARIILAGVTDAPRTWNEVDRADQYLPTTPG